MGITKKLDIMMNFYNERNKTGSPLRQNSDYTSICIQIDMQVEALIFDAKTNKKLMRIRNKLTSKKALTRAEIKFISELNFIV